MPTFVTPQPIDASVQVFAGRIEIHASDREDTVVQVVPSDPRNASHVEAANGTTVDYGAGRLTIATPKRFARFFGGESVTVRLLLPSGSRVQADNSFGTIDATGRLGASRVKSASGDISIDEAAELRGRAANGELSVRRVEGGLDVVSGNGAVRIGRVGGDATIRGAHGDVDVAEVGGRCDIGLASGSVHITRSSGTLTARSAYGSVRIDDLAAGSARLDAGYGQIEVSVRAGVAAWIDLVAEHGVVVNDLGPADAPGEHDATVSLRARAAWGGIRVGRTIGQPAS